MSRPSLTGTDSFRLRIQRSEVQRAKLMAVVYAVLLLSTFFRRLADGVVMSDNRIMIPTATVLIIAVAYEVFVVYALRRAVREGRLVTGWRLNLNAVFELAVPTLLLTVLHLWSPRGEYDALSAPALLLFPLTLLVSVLRLRPRTTLWLGVGAAALHGLLVLDTIRNGQAHVAHYPVLLAYPALLLVTGIAGMLVCRAARHYVAAAVEEAESHQRTGLRLEAIEHDLEVARQIQTGLLPNAALVFPGFDVAGMNQPADQTGGDYYDWQELPDGRLLVALADVTGHGIGPALVMAVCRAYARATAPLDSDPASLMARLNTLLHADMQSGRFITLAMAMLDRDGAVELVSAGHGPSLLFIAAEGRIEQFGGDGLPLAIMLDERYGPSRRFTMRRGDVLVMLTDGVFEWQNSEGRQFGTAELDRVLAAAATRSAAEIIAALNEATMRHAGGTRQMDDVTIVVIKRCA